MGVLRPRWSGGRLRCGTRQAARRSRPRLLPGQHRHVASAVGLSTGQQIWKVWHSNFLWTAPSYFVGAGAAAGAAAWAWSTGWGWLVPLAVAPVYLTFRSYTVYLERIAAEQRHHEEMVQAARADRRGAHGRQGVGTAVRAGGGRFERRPVGLGPERGRVLRLRSLEADGGPAGREPVRAASRTGSATSIRKTSSDLRRVLDRHLAGETRALRARIPDVAPRRPRPLDAVPRRRRAGRDVAPGAYRRLADRHHRAPPDPGRAVARRAARRSDRARQPRAVHRAARALRSRARAGRTLTSARCCSSTSTTSS